MISDVIKAISIALNAEFGPEYEIYGEEIRQGKNRASSSQP